MTTWSPSRIKALRTRLGLTQEGLAEKLGVKKNTVYTWESGRRNPDLWRQSQLLSLERRVKKGVRPA